MKALVCYMVAGLTLLTPSLLAQDIETQLPGNTASQGFTVKDNSSNSLFTTRGDGKVAIGTTTPEFKLTLDNDGGIIARGTFGSGATLTTSGTGARLIWYPKKAAFRAGYCWSTTWDDGNIGDYSTAMGAASNASGFASIAIGFQPTASGYVSTAMGSFTTASGDFSTAMGANTEASGYVSTAMGSFTTASGNHSTAMGQRTTANSYLLMSIGRWNIGGGSLDSWVATDPLFEIGIGTSSAPANALTVLKNGNVGICTAAPSAGLEIDHDGTGGNAAYFHIDNSSSTSNCLRAVTTSTNTASDALEVEAVNGNALDASSSGGTYPTIWAYNTNSSLDAKIISASSSQSTSNEVFSVKRSGDLEITGKAYKPGGGNWSVSSDIRLKNIDGTYERGLTDIARLHSVRFHYKPGNPRNLPSDRAEIGFIAQEVQQVFPECVTEGSNGYLNFNMHAINVALVNAAQELKSKLESEHNRIEELTAQVSELQSQLAGLHGQLAEEQERNVDRESRYVELQRLVRDLQQERSAPSAQQAALQREVER